MSEKKENGLIRFIVIALVASIAMLPMVFYGCSPEWARWDASQAHAFFREGETSDALYQLRDAIRKSPRDPVLKLTLANRLIEMDESVEALNLANLVLDVYPDNISAMETKYKAEQRMGDFEASLETQLEIHKNLHAYMRKSYSLNALAYARGLAGKDLHLAKEDIDAAIQDLNRSTYWSGNRETRLHLEVKAIILAALISRCCDASEATLEVLGDEIDSLHEIADFLRDDLRKEVYGKSGDQVPIEQDSKIRNRRQQLRSFETQIAHLLSCRALLYQDLGKTELSQYDRLMVKNLAYDSSEIVSEFPDDMTCLIEIGNMWPLLDTRGFIGSLPLLDLGGKQKSYVSSYSESVRDLNIAVLCCQVVQKSYNSSLRNSVAMSTVAMSFDREQEIKDLKHQCAVLLYHRMMLHERRGNAELAAKDYESIRSLNFKPGPHLY